MCVIGQAAREEFPVEVRAGSETAVAEQDGKRRGTAEGVACSVDGVEIDII